MASSTVSSNLGLLMEDFDAPERMERVSIERWLGAKLDDRTLESTAENCGAGGSGLRLRLERRREDV